MAYELIVEKDDEYENSVGLSNWRERAKPAYENGQPTYLDSQGELIEGIYLDMTNDVYHALPALSSSKLKKFIDSPAHYYREYLSDITRKRTTAMQNTFDAGTHSHTLVLEPQGYYQRYFRDVMPIDYPDALHTAAQIEAQLLSLGLKKSGTKAEKTARLIEADPTAVVFEDIQQREYDKQGIKGTETVEGVEVTTYGGKIPVDGQVWDDAHRAAKTTREHNEANAYLSNGLPEVAMIHRCHNTGLMLKVKFDWLRFDDEAVDLKTTLSTRPEKFLRQLNDLHYDVQQEFYKYVALLSGIEIKEFTFVTTEYFHADICQPYNLSLSKIIHAIDKVQQGLKNMADCIETNVWYGWSKDDCTMTLV
ncbi:PD-(D/E)XK nuclease-like domain-containing protein [Colwellia sp. 6_MG-2023]|uniref:PD-(D/E)XK nuclease-like domain-containing protein n=1 Tax=Colwellia sp. 6_MG-2023 TaxID=3062676 RepID=UPI0026E44D03|nr:PD-(D/E)XK nuclease-like domain-containing protein [Colwellia sp. 6_MG-2023]MDO6488055.1 PD-(D/E)XK nuclease-like domain-containing protein [Colwellia sp. 6_MG-2023]